MDSPSTVLLATPTLAPSGDPLQAPLRQVIPEADPSLAQTVLLLLAPWAFTPHVPHTPNVIAPHPEFHFSSSLAILKLPPLDSVLFYFVLIPPLPSGGFSQQFTVHFILVSSLRPAAQGEAPIPESPPPPVLQGQAPMEFVGDHFLGSPDE